MLIRMSPSLKRMRTANRSKQLPDLHVRAAANRGLHLGDAHTVRVAAAFAFNESPELTSRSDSAFGFRMNRTHQAAKESEK